MGVLDLDRRTLRLDPPELALVGLALAEPEAAARRHPGTDAVRGSLEAAAILAGGTVAPLAAGLVAVVLRPQLRVAVEVLRGGAVVARPPATAGR